MANDLNRCEFIGRLGKDPEVRYMGSGDPVASFTLAVGSAWKDKNTAETKESTEWVSISAFGKLASMCEQYLVKGRQIYVSGKMKTEKWTDKEGHAKYTTKIVADTIQMLGSKSDASAPRESKKSDEPEFDEADIPF